MSNYCSRPNCFVESPHEHITGSTLNDVINYHMAKCLTPQCTTYIASGGYCGQCNRETATIQSTESTIAELRAEIERLRKAESIIASRRFELIQKKHRGGLIIEEQAVLDALTEIAREIAPPLPPLPDALKGAQ